MCTQNSGRECSRGLPTAPVLASQAEAIVDLVEYITLWACHAASVVCCKMPNWPRSEKLLTAMTLTNTSWQSNALNKQCGISGSSGNSTAYGRRPVVCWQRARDCSCYAADCSKPWDSRLSLLRERTTRWPWRRRQCMLATDCQHRSDLYCHEAMSETHRYTWVDGIFSRTWVTSTLLPIVVLKATFGEKWSPSWKMLWAISLQPFDQFWLNLVRRCTLALPSWSATKICKSKMVDSGYLDNGKIAICPKPFGQFWQHPVISIKGNTSTICEIIQWPQGLIIL